MNDFDPGKLMQYIDRISDIMTNALVNNDLDILDEFKTLLKQMPHDSRVNEEFKHYINALPPVIIRPKHPINVDILKFKGQVSRYLRQLPSPSASLAVSTAITFAFLA
jgi:hypothetical protein